MHIVRLRRLSAFIVTGVGLASAPAHANLTISTASTSNVTCSGGVCSATASNAVLNVTDLTNLLASGDVTVKSTNKAVDIVIADTFSWVSANGLTLDSYRSITFQQAVVAAGPGGLAITTNDGGTGGDFQFAKKGQVEFWDTKSKLEIGGHSYTLVKTLKQLAAKIGHNPHGFFALARKDNAAKDGTYSASPIATSFSGVFEGLGNAIDGLTVAEQTTPSDIGLFAQLAVGGVVRDVKLAKVSFNDTATSAAGALVGDNLGTVANSSVSGQVTNSNAGCTGSLVGFNEQGATVSGSSSTAKLVSNYGGTTIAGGLVGCSEGAIRSSTSKGSVTGPGSSEVGGLAGYNFSHGVITASSSSSTVTATDANTSLGGLVGRNDGMIENSSATGDAVNGTESGGLVGNNVTGTITLSFATGNVSVNATVAEDGGGLAGQSTGTISQCYATGSVTGGTAQIVGGLIGWNSGAVQDSYATGDASTSGGSSGAGGLAGLNFGTIARAYSTGKPSDDGGKTGGSVGYDNATAGSISSDYWDTSTSGITNLSQGAGNIANDPGITGLSNSQLKSGLPAGFSSSIWGESASINGGLPYLLALPPK
jgi:hypothetical protein